MEQLPGGYTLNICDGAFPLSTDSIALADFVKLPRNANVLDLGSGCGSLGLLLCASDPCCTVTGIEISQAAHQAACDNIADNQLTRLHSICADLRMNTELGVFTVKAGAVVLAMGCRERPRGALNIAGSRPAGIFTAGTAQKYVNMKGYMPGREVVILGSGDIGLIMARRMTLEGAKVKAVLELMPYSGGLARNIEQCLNDFDIPLMLSHTVVKVHGKERVEAVTIAAVDENRRPIPATMETISCDTLLLSCGLIPENELTVGAGIGLDRVTGGAVVNGERETEIPGIFAAGNVLHVHDLVDYVSEEAVIAGRAAVRFIKGESAREADISLVTDGKIRYTVPQKITEFCDTRVYFRVSDVFRDKKIVVRDGDTVIFSRKKQKLAPGEMETITLKGDALRAVESGRLTLSLED